MCIFINLYNAGIMLSIVQMHLLINISTYNYHGRRNIIINFYAHGETITLITTPHLLGK